MSATKDSIFAPRDRIGLSRPEAAAYIGISAPLFDNLVRAGRMPNPKRIGSRLILDRREVEVAFTNLSEVDTADQGVDAEAEFWAP